jgi:hypothetical protein
MTSNTSAATGGSITLAELIGGYCAAYAGRDSARLSQLAYLKTRPIAATPIADITSDDIGDVLDQFAAEPCRTFMGWGADGKPIYRLRDKKPRRPRELTDEQRIERRRARYRQWYREKRTAEAAGVIDLPAVSDDDLEVDLPIIDPVDIAKAMRLAGLQAAQFAQRTMNDEKVDVKHRLAAASLLASRGWMDAPRDPSVLIDQRTVTFDRATAERALAKLRGEVVEDA